MFVWNDSLKIHSSYLCPDCLHMHHNKSDRYSRALSPDSPQFLHTGSEVQSLPMCPTFPHLGHSGLTWKADHNITLSKATVGRGTIFEIHFESICATVDCWKVLMNTLEMIKNLAIFSHFRIHACMLGL